MIDAGEKYFKALAREAASRNGAGAAAEVSTEVVGVLEPMGSIPATERQTRELEVITAAALCARPDPSREAELLGPMLVRGQRTVIGGHTGEGKTTLALQLVRAAVEKRECLEWTGAGGRALIVDAEQGERTVRKRLREAGLDESVAVDLALVPDGLALDRNVQDIAALEEQIERGKYDVVLLDPLYKLHSGDSNDERQAVDLMRTLDAWRSRYGFALLLLVHCRKPVPGMKFSIHDLFGSSAYVRGAEVVLGLQRVSDGYGRLHFLKDRDGDLPTGKAWGLLFDREQGFRRDPNDGEERDLETEIRSLLEGEPDRWRTVREVSAPSSKGGLGANRDTVQAIVERLRVEGVLAFAIGPAGRSATAHCYRLAQAPEPPAQGVL